MCMRLFFFRRHTRQSQPLNTQQQTPPRFQWLGGRRFLADAPYALPKDPQEVRRLDFQHFMIRQEMHGNYLAPLSRPKSILDVGCGTGRWAMEMAAEFPQANVVGIDLVLPDSAASLGHGLERQPENVSFLEADALNGLPFADASFDFVYMRFLFTAIPAAQWPALLDEAIRVTRSQGWIESVESWATMSEASPGSHTITEWINELLRQRGLDPLIARKVPEMMHSRGLEQIITRELPHTPPERSTRWKQIYSTIGLGTLDIFRTQIISQGIVTAEQYDLVAATAREEVLSTGAMFWPAYITYGRRPAVPDAKTPSPGINLAEKQYRLLSESADT
jgi:ubiquinone/menaquinone biosynthesis C-methylase UbiE